MYPFNIYIAFEKYGVKSQQGSFPVGTSVFSSPVNIEIDFLCAFFWSPMGDSFLMIVLSIAFDICNDSYKGREYLIATRRGKYLKC